jgi:predicted lipoprotein with Yx(FWY)xxD motif
MAPTRRAVLGLVATVGVAGCVGGSDGSGGTTPTSTAAPTDTPGDPATPTATGTAATVAVDTHPDFGEILVGPEGLTLYMFDQDTRGADSSACAGGCAEAWPPLTVDDEPSAGEGATVEVTTFEREDGRPQVVAGGWPLYYFASDEAPGDANGQGVNDVWWVLAPDGTPVRTGGGTPTPTPAPTGGGGGGDGPY